MDLPLYKIKVFIPPEEWNILNLKLPLMIEQNKFEFVNNFEDSDFLIFLNLNKEQLEYYSDKNTGKKKIKFLTFLFFHTWEKENIKDFLPIYLESKFGKNQKLLEKILVVDGNLQKKIPKIGYLIYDFCFNRQKLYFTEYDKHQNIDLSDCNYAYTRCSTKQMFCLNEIKKNNYCKKFISANRNYVWVYDNLNFVNFTPEQKKFFYRNEIVNYAKQNTESFWYSDWSNPNDVKILEPQEENIFRSYNLDNSYKFSDSAGWMPINNFYYESSFISVYVESLSSNSHSRLLSEKTFDPLIKGHFILPFAYSGITKDILSYGFKLPEFIDYSYDLIGNDKKRFIKFVDELERLNSFEIEWFYDKYIENKWILEHNRNLFYNRPFDSLYEKLLPYISRLF